MAKREGRRVVPVIIVETGEVFKSIMDCARRLEVTRGSLADAIEDGRSCRGCHVVRLTPKREWRKNIVGDFEPPPEMDLTGGEKIKTVTGHGAVMSICWACATRVGECPWLMDRKMPQGAKYIEVVQSDSVGYSVQECPLHT